MAKQYLKEQKMYLERDLVKLVALILLIFSLTTLALGLYHSGPQTFGEFAAGNYSEWIGLFADAVLLWVLNWIIKRQEKERIITQMASESNAFALDAIKQIQRRGWFDNGALRGRDLEHANLQFANLREADLSRSELNYACLKEARLFGADLSDAGLMAADLRGAELRSAVLRGANLRWANLENAVLDGADLTGADLRFANVNGVNLDQANTEGAFLGAPLSPREATLVQESFQLLTRDFEDFAKWFYFRLFYLAPQVKSLFLGNLKQQRKKFMQTLGLLIQSLDDTNKIIPVLQMLGKRHLSYGVRDEYYDIVGEALLWAIEKKLAGEFTQEVRNAWAKTYEVITMVMKDSVGKED
jgi:hemoglobin-like flavoprotein